VSAPLRREGAAALIAARPCDVHPPPPPLPSPFGVAAAAAPDNYVVAAFGDVFDGAVLPAPHLRRFATRWASWSVGPLLSVYAPVRVTRRHHLP
jgi:hypothetical protein